MPRHDAAYFRARRAQKRAQRETATATTTPLPPATGPQDATAQPRKGTDTGVFDASLPAKPPSQEGVKVDTPAVEQSPLRARDPATGRFPARPVPERVPVAPPCAVDVFDRVCIRLLRGDIWRDIQADEGLQCWAEVDERGRLTEHRDRWQSVKVAMGEADRVEVRDTGKVLLRTARAELPASEDTEDGPRGTITRRSLQRAASTATAGAALVDPATHGRQAGRSAPVTVNATNAAIFGGPPPSVPLEDYTQPRP